MVVPRTRHAGDKIVACSYWIYERERIVRVDKIAALSLPI
jgi:hypothetical protein